MTRINGNVYAILKASSVFKSEMSEITMQVGVAVVILSKILCVKLMTLRPYCLNTSTK